MPDSDAVRKRRSRKHGDGDHSLCIPGRCEVLDEADGVVVEPDGTVIGLGVAGQRLHDAIMDAGALPPTTMVMVLEACRIVDRLERLDRQLHGGDWLRFRRREDELHVIVHMDRALAEAREQATALRGLLADIEKALAAREVPKTGEGGGVIADFTAKLAERRRQASN